MTPTSWAYPTVWNTAQNANPTKPPQRVPLPRETCRCRLYAVCGEERFPTRNDALDKVQTRVGHPIVQLHRDAFLTFAVRTLPIATLPVPTLSDSGLGNRFAEAKREVLAWRGEITTHLYPSVACESSCGGLS